MAGELTHLEAGEGEAPKEGEKSPGRSVHASRGAKRTKKRKAWAALSSSRQSVRRETEDLAYRCMQGEELED